MFIAGAKYLESKKNYVDELNVFPVPDGDTGTNMTLTILAAAKEVEKANGSDIKAVAKAISSGSLRGARGNSGVILSQLFRGFAKEVGLYETLDTVILANAMGKGVETAYKAVMKPKEGTILTVARGMADKAAELAVESRDIIETLKAVIEHGNIVLEQTPDMLPVLKEAGVVDAGGQGLVYVLKGALMALESGTDMTLELEEDPTSSEVKVNVVHAEEDIKFGYCTEFIVDTQGKNTYEENEEHALRLKQYLATLGDSIVTVYDEEIIKVHVHTNDPGLAMQKGLSIGRLMNIKVDNMRIQHEERVIHGVDSIIHEEENAEVEMKPYAFVAVAAGDGMQTIFESLGVDYVVTGGQTMNPSTEDFAKAVETLHAEHVYILPNNKNIILAATQVNDIVDSCEVHVVQSRSIPQGIAALIAFDPEGTVDANLEEMNEAMGYVKTGQVTFAVRDTSIDSKPIKEGDILGIGDDTLRVVHPDKEEATKELLKELLDVDSELVSIYYGEDQTEEDAKALGEFIHTIDRDVEVEIHYGGQPLYYYILSVE